MSSVKKMADMHAVAKGDDQAHLFAKGAQPLEARRMTLRPQNNFHFLDGGKKPMHESAHLDLMTSVTDVSAAPHQAVQ